MAAAASIAAAGCTGGAGASASGDDRPAAASPQPDRPAERRTLAATLDERQAEFAQRADDDVKALYADGIQSVRDQAAVERAKDVGDRAPGFTLLDHGYRPVSLSGLLEDGPVVLLWYRGGWCPYCNLTLAAYQDHLDEINAQGATLVALSPEVPDRSLSTKEKNELDFVVLSDTNNAVARQYGVVFALTPGVHERYNEAFEFDSYNGNSSGELPLAATYVIDRDGIIRWAFLDADYRERAEPADVVAALRALR